MAVGGHRVGSNDAPCARPRHLTAACLEIQTLMTRGRLSVHFKIDPDLADRYDRRKGRLPSRE